jgi:cobyrinic acid a,c-diamide synthase
MGVTLVEIKYYDAYCSRVCSNNVGADQEMAYASGGYPEVYQGKYWDYQCVPVE